MILGNVPVLCFLRFAGSIFSGFCQRELFWLIRVEKIWYFVLFSSSPLFEVVFLYFFCADNPQFSGVSLRFGFVGVG